MIVYVRLMLFLSFILGLALYLGGLASAGSAAAPPVGGWQTYTNTNCVYDLALAGDYVWAATCGGVVRWSRVDGSYVTYTTANGLPHNNIGAIGLDGQGQPWVAPKRAGLLSHFDGERWITYTPADGLPGGSIEVLAIDEAGQLWLAGGAGEISRVDLPAGSSPDFSSRTRLATLDNSIYALASDPSGRIWAGTYEGGLVLIDGQNRTYYTSANGLADDFVNDIAIDAKGQVWVATGKGLSLFDGQNWTTYTVEQGLVDNYVQALLIDNSDRLWVGTSGGLSVFDGVSWASYTTAEGLAGNDISALRLSDDGHLWAGGSGGLNEFDGQNWRAYITDNGLGNLGRASAIAFDPAGRVWFGSSLAEVSVFDGQRLTVYTNPSRPQSGGVRALVIDQEGQLWLGAEQGLGRFDGQSWTIYTAADGLASDQVNALAVDGAGQLWIGTNQGLTRFDGHNWQNYAVDDLKKDYIKALLVDPAGQIWAGTSGGLRRFDGQSWSDFTTADGLVGDDVQALAADGTGQIWVGTTAGLSRFDGQSWTSYTTANGLADNGVKAIAVDGAGRVWVATWGGGVSRFDGQSWTTYTVADGLAYDFVNTVAVDPAGQVWVGTDFGVNRRPAARGEPATGDIQFTDQLAAELLAQGYITQTQEFRQNVLTYRAMVYQPANFMESTAATNYLLIYKLQGDQSTLLYELREEQRLEIFDDEGQPAPLPGWLDMNGDGLMELPYRTINGGNCWGCSQLRVLQHRGDDSFTYLTEATPPQDRLGGNFVLQSLIDVNDDGVLEWQVLDARWEFAFGLCHACSPAAFRLYAWDGSSYHNASAEFPEYYQPILAEGLAAVEQLAGGDAAWSGAELGQLISLLLNYENAGRGQEGWAIFEQYSDPALYEGQAGEAELHALVEAREYFRTWYEPAPASATDYNLSLPEPSFYLGQAGYIHVIGSVANNAPEPLQVVLIAGLYDAGGAVLDVASGPLPFSVIEPGQTLPYDLSGFNLIDNIDSQTSRAAQARVRVAWASPHPARVILLETRPSPPEQAGLIWRFEGEVINNTEEPLEGAASVVIAIYDDQNRLAAVGDGVVYGRENTRINPQEVIPYRISIDLPPTLNPATMTVQIYAQGLALF
jgi:ligand-binding sensor domain-containing protein